MTASNNHDHNIASPEKKNFDSFHSSIGLVSLDIWISLRCVRMFTHPLKQAIYEFWFPWRRLLVSDKLANAWFEGTICK